MNGTNGGSYAVGYRKPPVATRFQKGASGNPKGRPAKAKAQSPASDFGEAEVDDVVIAEALRPITVRENGKAVTMPMIQAVMRSLGVEAVKGHHKSQLTIATMVRDIQVGRNRDKADLFGKVIDYKRHWQKEFELCDRMRKPRPEPMPHPDEMAVDLVTMEVTFNGPRTEDEKKQWDDFFAIRQKCVDGAAALHRSLKRRPKNEAQLREDLKPAELFIKLIDCVLPDKQTRRQPGFDLRSWRQQQRRKLEYQEISRDSVSELMAMVGR